MKGYQAKCPLLVKRLYHNILPPTISVIGGSDDIVCGYGGFEILAKGIFTKESGYDPAGLKVKCRKCGGMYYLFPQVNAKEVLV